MVWEIKYHDVKLQAEVMTLPAVLSAKEWK
jgi:hypothetical protein